MLTLFGNKSFEDVITSDEVIPEDSGPLIPRVWRPQKKKREDTERQRATCRRQRFTTAATQGQQSTAASLRGSEEAGRLPLHRVWRECGQDRVLMCSFGS